MAPEDGGLLGNLPRSRPGTRSAKRASPGQGAARKAQGPSRAQRANRTKPRSKAPGAPKAGTAPRNPPVAEERRDTGAADPVGDALRTAARAGQAGARVASELTREVLRRLPRL